tara:strand:+ start:109 stop:615 length:507 start_codon:yes stop_codon:yes gene_type:complete
MTKSVYLYLASGVIKGTGFWLINYTEEENIFNYQGKNLLECYRRELFGLNAAIEVKKAINTTLDILSFELRLDKHKIDNYNTGYSSEIPINLIEDVFDLWAYNYKSQIKWIKYLGLLQFRKKINTNNSYITMGLRGDTYEFAKKLNRILSYRNQDASFRQNKSKDVMW